jgi:hypothetical protein
MVPLLLLESGQLTLYAFPLEIFETKNLNSYLNHETHDKKLWLFIV